MFLSNRKPEIHWNDMTSVLRVQFTLLEYCARTTVQVQLHSIGGYNCMVLSAMCHDTGIVLYTVCIHTVIRVINFPLGTLDIVSPLFISNDVGYLYSSTCICTSTGLSIIQCTGVPNITNHDAVTTTNTMSYSTTCRLL
jgi:hypothetical protein